MSITDYYWMESLGDIVLLRMDKHGGPLLYLAFDF